MSCLLDMGPARSWFQATEGQCLDTALAPAKSRQGEFQQCNEEMIALPGAFWMGGTLGIPGCAVSGGIYTPCIVHIAPRVNENQSKSLLWKILLVETGLS